MFDWLFPNRKFCHRIANILRSELHATGGDTHINKIWVKGYLKPEIMGSKKWADSFYVYSTNHVLWVYDVEKPELTEQKIRYLKEAFNYG